MNYTILRKSNCLFHCYPICNDEIKKHELDILRIVSTSNGTICWVFYMENIPFTFPIFCTIISLVRYVSLYDLSGAAVNIGNFKRSNAFPFILL